MEIPKVELNVKKSPIPPFGGFFLVQVVSGQWFVVEKIVTPTQVGVHCVLLRLVITMDTGRRRYDGNKRGEVPLYGGVPNGRGG